MRTQLLARFQKRNFLLLSIISLLFINELHSQTTVQIGTGTTLPAATLYSPVYRFSATSTTTGSRSNILFLPSEMATAGIAPGATITKIEFNKGNVANFVTPATHSMYMGNTSNTTLPTSTTWASILSSHTQVYTNNAFNIPSAAGWVEWNITPFVYTGGSLEIATETAMVGNGGATSFFQWEYTDATPTDLIVGASSATATTLNGTVAAYKHRPNIRITYTGGVACSGTPTAGTAASSVSDVCPGTPFTLTLTGNTAASGIEIQWQSSPDNSSWTDIPTATTSTFNTTQLVNTYYRARVTCTNSGLSQNSNSVLVTSPGLVSGIYTINNALPTGGTNFTSFNDAYAFLACGINGPVVFNVDAASGPYTEQLIINPVFGTSATNTVTFNGNGRTIQFTSTNTNERAVVKLNGADHFIFDSLVINSTATVTGEYAFTVQLINDADSNTFRKCVINAPTEFVSTNHAAVVISGSATSATSTTAIAGCDYNVFDQNQINGGYYGITNVSDDAQANRYNSFTRNIIKDFYLYGIYTYGSFSTLIEGNDISRPTRVNISTGTSQGIYFTGLSTLALVNANRIHDFFTTNTSTTNDFYGIYFTGVDALNGIENKVTNNVVYSIKSNGLIYGIYNAGSNNALYYHNTVSLDDAASTSTEATRGFYQTTTAAGIILKNNLFTIRRGGTGVKTGIYFNTIPTPPATIGIESDYNNVFFGAATNASYGSWGAAAQTTLNDWRTISGQDANSLAVNPFYINLSLGNLQPTSAGLNDLGTPVGVTTDILGAARSATTPDIGAWEYAVGPCAAPPDAGESTSSVAVPICPNELVTLGLVNNSQGTGQTYQWQSGSTSTGPWTDISAVLNAASFNINPTTTLYYRAAVTCSGMTEYSVPVQVVVNPLFPGGTYTINSTQPTGGTNFQSFNAAYDAMRCGIAGPIVFNVVTGTGPYNEQLIMGEIQGTSQSNTVTWNGNGETITFLSTNTNERAVIKFNGTDHFIFDSLVVVPQGTTTSEYGFGFHLINNADSNIIRKCVVNVNTTSTSTNYAGIVSSQSHTSATGTGAGGGDFNLIDSNTVTGGYYGITNVASTTEATANSIISNNKVRDFYFYGIYLSGNFNTLVEANDISRPTRTTVSTCYGVYMTALSTSVKVSKNRIHNPFDGNTASTSTFAGVYITAVDALNGVENIVSNNAIYNVNGGGTQYGLYNSSSNNVFYYHNTINLDGAASSTNDSYGFYQVTTASGIDLKNNLITISRSNNGDKYGLYFSTSTTTFTSDNNGFYRNTTNAHVGYNGSNQTTLTDWQTATGQDANSVSGNPYYTNASAGNLEPRSALLDDKGTFVGITTDIENETRSAVLPDIGAWEFLVPPCTTPPTPGTATATPNIGICLGTPVLLDLSGNSIGAGQTYQWQVATAAAGPYTNLGNLMAFPDTTIFASGTFWYRAVVTCSGQSVNSAPVQVNMNPPFPAGTYTINNTQPTTWPGGGVGSNFNSFVEAVAVMDCGIAGPVTFNVAAGTYTEQVRMHAITGTSATSRVTFQSATGVPASVVLTYDATASNYVLQLDSASYITYKNMTITAANTTNGRAVDFAHIASYDSLLNCVINVPASTSTATAVVGVHADDFEGTDLVIKGNTITGGMAGIYISGTSTTLLTHRNVIDSNIVSGAYYYNIYSLNARYSTVTRNTITATLPRNTTSYGIYLSNNDSAYQVNGNKVTINGTTATAYGIYLTGCAADANTGSVSGNIITANTGITGTLYGMYQTACQGSYTSNNVIDVASSGTTAFGLYSTSGNGIKYYNNTVQNASTPSASTNNSAAYISHSTSTIDIGDIRNNIFSHTGSGFVINFVNVDNIYSDFNMFYSANSNFIRQNTVSYPTLQAWRDADGWDLNSIVYQPAFISGTLQPDAGNANSWAMHGRGVQITDNATDVLGSPRPTTLTTGVPDLGAYEFLPTVQPPVLPATPAAPSAGTTQVFMFGTDTVQKITWNPASTVPTNVEVRRYSGIIPPGLATGQASMYFYTDVDYTGSAPTSFDMKQFYIDPWMRDIPAEPTVKMGRTDASAAWFVSSNSTVHTFYNTITEQNLSFLDKFTGMTDGVAPPDGTIVSTDTSNRGRRFWVGYGHHSFFDANSQNMVLYLSAEDAANVTVKINGTNWQRTYSIPANTVRVSDFIPKTGFADARLKTEGLSERGISIESDVPIVVYAHIYASLNSGASMLLPVGTYGYEYTSLNSAQFYPTEGDGPHSWFYVVADRDSTLVEITPSQNTSGGRVAGVPFQVYLDKGEIYNVMGTYSQGVFNGNTGYGGVDMSGSTIKSIPNASGKCFPVAVFSGSSRTSLCNDFGGDNLIQQMFPNQAWGTKYLTFGTAKSGAFPTTYNSNKWRILVKDPATVVKRNGVTIDPATLVVPGNYYEFGITQGDGPSTSSYIEADQPIMLAQYMISLNGADCGLAAPTGLSDPEMIYISPIEQGIKRAVFYNTDVSNIDANYINVVIPTAGLASLTIDGNNTFTDVFAHPQLPGYSCVRHNLAATAGQHIIQSDSAFNAITYGMGAEESYGYNAGTLVKNLTALPSFNNVFNTGSANTYTCKGTPFRLSVQISVKPTQMIWQLSQVPNITPNADITQVNPVPADSVTVNGKKFYIYTLAQQFVFNQTGNYTIPIQIFHPSIEGCNGSYEITLPVAVIPAPVSDFTVTGSGCVNDVLSFSATTTTANAVPVNQWTWNFGDTGTGAGQNVTHTYTTAGTYNVMVRGIADDGCIGDTTKPVVINARPVVAITQDTVYVCNNANATFTVQNPVQGVTYNWFATGTGGTPIGTGTTFVLNNVTGLTAVYLEGVQAGCNSVVRDTAYAAILPAIAAPTVVVDSVSTNTIVFRWNAVTGATGYQVSVDGGNTWVTPSSGNLGLTHTVTGLQLGTTVTLRVRALGSCIPAESQPVTGQTITDQVFIPNSFTPNGDGLNDVLRVYSNVIRQMRFAVFNQWGEKIYESTSQLTAWDGSYKGKPQPSGVYMYVCDITLNTGERIQRKGAINLVR